MCSEDYFDRSMVVLCEKQCENITSEIQLCTFSDKSVLIRIPLSIDDNLKQSCTRSLQDQMLRQGRIGIVKTNLTLNLRLHGFKISEKAWVLSFHHGQTDVYTCTWY